MRESAIVVLCLLSLGCDPGRTEHVLITPPGGAPVSDSVRQVSAAITAAAAARHRLRVEEESTTRRCFARAVGGATLRLCEGPATTGGLDVWVSEAITSNWSPVGDSLRHEVTDTLRTRFGPWVTQRE